MLKIRNNDVTEQHFWHQSSVSGKETSSPRAEKKQETATDPDPAFLTHPIPETSSLLYQEDQVLW